VAPAESVAPADLGFAGHLRILRALAGSGQTMKTPQFNVLSALSTLLLMTSVLLTGCGQYGDLYLPNETATQEEERDDTEQQEETEVSQPEDL
jgi:predicted small lipoprotein YifL